MRRRAKRFRDCSRISTIRLRSMFMRFILNWKARSAITSQSLASSPEDMAMDKDLARHAAHVALASATRLDGATYALEKNCSPDEFAVYRQAIANVTACVDREILDKVY